ncbi:MAG: glycosyltransferase family 4 protein [Candidatus Hadarchaeum sp.]|uniref:glycosyltransferase family 4 protein n=1 Tax=Candidatus Hadarchaeum sp. TaxID=2883567 RepID=UPI003D0C5905
MKEITFLYPASGISPHPAHLAWAKSVGSRVVETPMGIGCFDQGKLKGSNILLLESLYCAPFARRYKKKNPECRVISIIADTSFWRERLSIFRRIYYWRYLPIVDGFIAVSERIKRDIQNYVDRPVEVVRPFPVNKFRPRKRDYERKILFIGNEAREKGYSNLVKAMDYLPDFELFLVGDCCRKVRTKKPNIHLEGRVPSLKPYFQKCSIYAHPADFDPCPSVVWEAMYAGLIPIITRGVGQGELFSGDLGRLVLEKNDPKSIADKILEVYSIPDKSKLIKKCMRLSEEHTKEKSVRRFKEAFHRLLKEIK